MRHWIPLLLLLTVACTPQARPTLVQLAEQQSTPTEEPFYAWDFSLASLDGTIYTLSDLRGKWVIINFWATWCVPCVEEMPALQEFASRYMNEVIVLGINQREEAELVKQFAENHHITFPLLLNPDDAVLTNYQVMKTPQTIIVDPNGEIVWRQFGPVNFEELESIVTRY